MTDCSLYLVSPPSVTLSAFLPQLAQALAHPRVRAFQLRLKEADDRQILDAAKEILPIARAHDVAFILNDRADLVRPCGADGVHLGQDDMKIAEARALAGADCVIGVSCHASRHLAIEASEQGADYVAFGAFFPTTSKSQEKIDRWGVPGIDLIEWWSTHTTVPCVAIGGMTPANCSALVKAGADFIAAITSVWNHPDGAGAAVEAFAQRLG